MISYSVTSSKQNGVAEIHSFDIKLPSKTIEIFKQRISHINVEGVFIDATIVVDKKGRLKQLKLERSRG